MALMLLVSDTLEGRGGIGGTSGLAGAELSSDWSAVTTYDCFWRTWRYLWWDLGTN